ncbi:MAG: zinc-ribbon domain-containing protein [Tyzzerella sp.]|nr:zinc-ribbon domain-containing protein [Tyzzerella sp.]MBQ4559801.1 zinc-ribbon domain-containing protein [Tyzzerella sp.]
MPKKSNKHSNPKWQDAITEEKKYIYCSNCGEKLVEGSKFCNKTWCWFR